MDVREYSEGDEPGVVRLWQRCELVVTHNNPRKDIQRKLAIQPELFLVGVVNGEIVATVMAGYEGHRGWLNYVAVDPSLQRSGLGREIVAEAESRLRELGCAKINLQVRRSNTGVMDFYRRLGFAEDDVASMGKRLEKD